MTPEPVQASPAVVRLHFVETGAGLPLVLIHGWGCDLHDWHELVDTWAADHRVIALDLRGHGRSPEPSDGYELTTLAADIRALLEQLPERAVLVGHSLGGALASVLAVEHPELVRAAVMLDPAYGRPPGHDERIRALLAGPVRGRDLCRQLQQTAVEKMRPDHREAHLRRLDALSDEVLDATLAGLWLAGADRVIRPEADRYLVRRRCPVLSIHAVRAAADWERTLLRHDASRSEFWPEVTHFLHYDRPAAAAATVLDWVAEIPEVDRVERTWTSSRRAVQHPTPAEPIVDVHLHVGHTVTREPVVAQTLDDALSRMAAHGISAAILSPAGGDELSRGIRSVQARNNALAAVAQEHADRFPLVLADVDPRLGARSASAEAERAMHNLQLGGVCLIPGMSGATVGAALRPILRVVDVHRGLCLLHPTPGAPAALLELAGEFEQVRFILAHGPMLDDSDRLRALSATGQVWFDTSQNCADPQSHRLRALIDTVGLDRVLFGGDSPYYDIETAVAVLRDAVASADERRAIAHDNAAALISAIRRKGAR